MANTTGGSRSVYKELSILIIVKNLLFCLLQTAKRIDVELPNLVFILMRLGERFKCKKDVLQETTVIKRTSLIIKKISRKPCCYHT